MSAANRGSDWWGMSSDRVKIKYDHDVDHGDDDDDVDDGDDNDDDDDDDDDEVGSPGGGPAQTRLPQSR